MKDLYGIVAELEEMFPGRPFTPDGHLVGSLGECLVADAFEVDLMPPSNEGFDARSADNLKVEIKTTQGSSIAFRSCPEHAIVIKIHRDGTFDTCFNGPGKMIWDQFKGKKLPKNGQYQISLSRVQHLNARVDPRDRIPLRA